MKKEDVAKLVAGIYQLHWKESQGGGLSIAAIGVTKSGKRWMAPINWVSPSINERCWRSVECAILLRHDQLYWD